MSELGGLHRGAKDAGEGVVIDVRGLRMRYGLADVLRGVEFVARRGEVLVLLGPNGAGKTTTIEILEGFRIRSAGEVRVLRVDPAGGMRPSRRGSGWCCSPGATTVSGGCGSCSPIWAGTTRLMGRRNGSVLTTWTS
jgi:hypothetical protein